MHIRMCHVNISPPIELLQRSAKCAERPTGDGGRQTKTLHLNMKPVEQNTVWVEATPRYYWMGAGHRFMKQQGTNFFTLVFY